MKKILLISFLTLPFLIFSQENQWRWQQEVDYKMVVDVNVEDHTYNGSQKLIFTRKRLKINLEVMLCYRE